MDRLKYLVIGILALALTGCGHTVVETLNVTGGPGHNAPGSGKSIVILPFADYSQGNLGSAQRRNMAITETMTDRLVSQGFGLPAQEDVFDYLVQEDIIQLASIAATDTSSLDYELQDVWSNEMKDQINYYKAAMEMEAAQKQESVSGTKGLSAQKIAKIGRHFQADYVIRGRILEFKTRQEASWLPWKKGLLPFVNGGTSKILFGYASSDSYDETNEMLTGMLYGATIGNNGASIFGLEDNGWGANQTIWAGIGGYAGEVSHRSGKVDEATVQMRVWVQEAATGNVVWTNRIRVQVSPESMFADNQYDTLFNTAIEKGVDALVDDFVTYGL